MKKPIKIVIEIVLVVAIFMAAWLTIATKMGNAAYHRAYQSTDSCLKGMPADATPSEINEISHICIGPMKAAEGKNVWTWESALYAAGATLVIWTLFLGLLHLVRGWRNREPDA